MITKDATMPGGATEHLALMPVGATEQIQIEFNNGMWWELPPDLNEALLRTYSDGYSQASYVWDWEGTRPGSHRIDGEPTAYNRYMIHFDTMMQVNIDNNRRRRVQIVHKVRTS